MAPADHRPPPPGRIRALAAREVGRARGALSSALASPGGPSFLARGAAAGTFAAMVPAFGLHLVLAVAVAFALRGSRPVAVASCLAVGNPLTHAFVVPLGYALGRALVEAFGGPPPTPGLPPWVPGWLAAGLPAAEEALLGGAVLGLLAAPLAYAATRALLLRRAARASSDDPGD